MKKFFSHSLLFVLFSIAFGCTKKTESPVLKVGDIVVSSEEFASRLIDEAKEFSSLKLLESDSLKQIKDKVISDLIIEGILLSWAQKSGIEVQASEISDLLAKKMQDYPDELAFNQTYSTLSMQKSIWEKKLKVAIVKKKLDAQFQPQVEIDEAAIKKRYWSEKDSFKRPAEIELQQIVVKTESEAEKIYQALKKGSEFAKLAKSYSLAAEAKEGGYVGWLEKGTLPVFDAAFKLPKKRISKPQKSAFGYHIFRVLNKKKHRKLPLDEVKKIFRDEALAREKTELYQNWLEKQLHEVKVLRNEEAIAATRIDIKGHKL